MTNLFMICMHINMQKFHSLQADSKTYNFKIKWPKQDLVDINFVEEHDVKGLM